MSHFNICSNIDNGVGLQKDAELLRDLLVEWKHTAKLVHYKKQGDIEEAPRARANIFLEVVAYNLVARRIADQHHARRTQIADHAAGWNKPAAARGDADIADVERALTLLPAPFRPPWPLAPDPRAVIPWLSLLSAG